MPKSYRVRGTITTDRNYPVQQVRDVLRTVLDQGAETTVARLETRPEDETAIIVDKWQVKLDLRE